MKLVCKAAILVGLVGALAMGCSTRSVTSPSRDMAIDFGDGVRMAFVWIEALKGWVGKYEVTNGEYRRFKADHNSGEYKPHSLNGDRQPVVMVSFGDAVAFAEWVNKTAKLPDGNSARLPDGTEWLIYAQCGDGRGYPWGNEWPPKYGNYFTSKEKCVGSCTVELSGKNDWGLYGVGGNAWEWTSEVYESDHGARALRGAAWTGGAQEVLRCSNRGFNDQQHRRLTFGFRLVIMPVK